VANSVLIGPEWNASKLRPTDSVDYLTVVHRQGIAECHDVDNALLALLQLSTKHLAYLRADGNLGWCVWQVG